MPYRSPSFVLKFAVAFATAAFLAALYLVLRQPWLGLSLRADYSLEQVIVDESRLVPVDSWPQPLHLTAISTAATGTLTINLDDLVEEPDLLGDNRRIAVFLERQAQLHLALQQELVSVTVTDAGGTERQLSITPGVRPPGSLPLAFWVQAVVAGASFLIGTWIWSLRQTEWGTRAFMVSGVGIMLAAMTAAVYSSRELAISGELFKALSAVNFSGAALFGAAMTGLFISYPKPLLRPSWMLILAALPMAVAVLHVLERYAVVPWLLPDLYLPPQLVLVEMACIILFVCIQWLATRSDPAARAVLRWLGMSIVVCSSLFVVLFYIPVVLGKPLVLSQGYSFLFFLLIYIGIALGLRRYRLFDLGTWAFRIMFYLSALLGFLLLDALIISLLDLGLNLSAGLALLVIGFGYLPLRDWLWRLTLGRSHKAEEKHYMEVMDIPFSTDPNEVNRKWQTLLRAVFDPLDLQESDRRGGLAALQDEGIGLFLPATASVSALNLKYCQGGKRLFSSADLHFAIQLLALLEHAERSRDAYERGRTQERRRIAQDLHDDIGASLLSSLHSEDLGAARSNIRKTIADLRAVVGGLVGTQTRLSVLVSTLRFESTTRLEEAGIEIDWPLTALEDSNLLVNYRFAKNLGSIVRELVSNILVHSGATRVVISSGITNGMLVLSVTDNGRGLANRESTGNGLANIQTRTRALNGSVAFDSTTPGLCVRLELPVAQDHEI